MISQWILLLHIIVGLAAIAPLTVIFIKHGREADRDALARWWSAGLWSGIGWAALGLSGLWLVGKRIWGVFVPYRMHRRFAGGNPPARERLKSVLQRSPPTVLFHTG